jgi:hypothetical protein
MNMHGKLLMVVLAASAMVIAGCKTTTQPGVTNSFGTYETLVEASPQATTQATTEAMQDLDLIIISSQASNVNGEVIARTPDDKRVSVTITPRPDNITAVSVRAGSMGNSNLSERLINRIKAKLYGVQTPPSHLRGTEPGPGSRY